MVDTTACLWMNDYRQSDGGNYFGILGDSYNRGENVAVVFKRIGRCGKEVWIQASHNPILDVSGKPGRS